MTRIYDDPELFVDDALTGFVAANLDYVARVDGGIVRSTETPPGQVSVVIVGGSGHYPAFAGLVGPGLAAGAACGNIFASPAAGQIYRVARAAHAGGGVLLSYGNYAGDVMHSTLAQQRLNAEGIETRTVLVTDDIASASTDETDKRRGIAGDLAVFKIAGAAAEAGLSLDEVEKVASKANKRTLSLGVAFDGCTLPGSNAPLFTVPAGHMSLGLGIHGEPGITDMPMPTATELAELLVSRLLEEKPKGAGTRVVVLLNGLGTIKYEELFLLYGKIAKLLLAAGLEIIEPECGELVTSLDMSGLSLTLLWLDDELEQYWSNPADTPAYRKGNIEPRAQRPATELEDTPDQPHEDTTEQAVWLGAEAAHALNEIRRVMVENEEILGDLDSIAGDGDHGSGMRRGADAAADAAGLAADAGAGVHEVLVKAGDQWAERAGGTSGALWCAALRAVAGSLGTKDEYHPDEAVAATTAMRDAVVELGKAEPGDKTMIDALIPFLDTLTAQTNAGEQLGTCLRRATERAEQAAKDTANLSPKKGRARPLAERSVGHPDPGAVSFALVASAVATYIQSNQVGSEEEP